MTSYRIETFCAFTGALQHIEKDIVDPMDAYGFCTTPWRGRSVHMVYMITPKGSRLWRAYAGGRCITPHLL